MTTSSTRLKGFATIIIALLTLTMLAHNMMLASATTFIEHNITKDTVWTKENSPYVITKNITIAKGASLTIEPGVEVRIPAGISITVEGKLIIKGEPGNLVTIKQQGKGKHWILEPKPGSQVTIMYTKISEELRMKSINKVNLAITSIYGNIEITEEMAGLGYGIISINDSSVSIVGVNGDVWIEGDGGIFYSNVSIVGVNGNVGIGIIMGIEESNVSIASINGSIGISGGIFDSNISIAGVHRDIWIEGGIINSSVSIANVNGNIEIRDKLPNIEGSNVSITCVNGNIEIYGGMEGIGYSNVSIVSVNGDIEISSESDYFAIGSYSTVVLSFVNAHFIRISSIDEDTNVLITNCTVVNGGIEIGSANGNVTIEFCNIYNNKLYGLSVEGGFVKAEYNWWGDSSGPYHPSMNPEGKGDEIFGNPHSIDFTPWLKHRLNMPPLPILYVEPSVTVAGQQVVFDARNSTDDGRVVAYFFDFGDGSTSGWVSTAVVKHRYAKPGNYTVSLMVKDDLGVVSRVNATAIVTVLPMKISPNRISITSSTIEEKTKASGIVEVPRGEETLIIAIAILAIVLVIVGVVIATRRR